MVFQAFVIAAQFSLWPETLQETVSFTQILFENFDRSPVVLN